MSSNNKEKKWCFKSKKAGENMKGLHRLNFSESISVSHQFGVFEQAETRVHLQTNRYLTRR